MGRRVTEGVAGGVVKNVAWFTEKLYSGERVKQWLEESGNPESQISFASYLDHDGPGQFVFVNDNEDSLAYTELIAYNDSGDQNSGWISMGINSSSYNDPDYDLTNKDEGFVLFKAPSGTTGTGNLTIATGDTGSNNYLVFGAGGYADWNNQMEIRPTTYSDKTDPDPANWVVATDAQVKINIDTKSTSPTTGALVVDGGVGITGDMQIQGDTIIEGNLQVFGSNTILNTITINVTDPIVTTGELNTSNSLDLGLVGTYGTATGPVSATVTNKAVTNNVATVTTLEDPHGFSVGDFVTISGVDTNFNSTFLIDTVPTTTTFTFRLLVEDVPSTAVSPTGSASVGSAAKYTGIVRDANENEWRIFSANAAKPSTTVDFSSVTYDAVRAGSLRLVANTGSTNTTTGSLIVTGGVGVSENVYIGGTLEVSGGVTFAGGMRVQEMVEDVVAVTGGGTITCDYTAGAVFNVSAPNTANVTVAITNAPTTDNRIFTINLIFNQGGTPGRPTSVTINGVSQGAPRYAAQTTPSGTANRIDIYTLTIRRVSGSYTVLASASLNF
jgi:hypothetical protein